MNPYYTPFPPQPIYPRQMPLSTPGTPSPKSSGNMTYIIISVVCVIVILIVSIIIVFYFKSKSGIGSTGYNAPKDNLNICDSRLNNGKCPEILNNINGKLCFATFNTDTGEYTLTDPNKSKIWRNNYIASKDNSNSPYTLNLTQSGNLSVNDNNNVVVWETKTTTGVAPAILKLQDNCNMELYDSQLNKLWESNTAGKNN